MVLTGLGEDRQQIVQLLCGHEVNNRHASFS
jgi:hypothetical protein